MLAPIAFAAAILLASGAAAQVVERERSAALVLSDRVRVETWLGYMRIWASESVYLPDGRRVSELEWRTGDASVVGTAVAVDASERLRFELSGWSALGSDNVMDDYDWLYPDRGWSHWSHHPDTELERAFQVDARVEAQVLERPGFALGLLAGYRVLNSKWQADNGRFVYSYAGFRDFAGAFSGPAIEYQQWWRTPYLGLSAEYRRPRLRLTGEVIASPFARVEDRDIHFMRDLQFNGSFEPTTMVALALGAERALGRGWLLSGGVDWQRYDEARGDMTVEDLRTGARYDFPDSAGADSEALLLRVGLARRF